MIEADDVFTEEDKTRLAELVGEGWIIKEARGTEVGYTVSRWTSDPLEALTFYDRFEKMDRFDRMMQLSFTNGVIDGITTYRSEIRKLGALWSKSAAIGDRLLAVIAGAKI